MRVLFGFVIGFILSIPSGAQSTFEALKEDIKIELDDIVEDYKMPGAIFSIKFDNERKIVEASGFSDYENGIAMNPDDLLLSGSVGKVFFTAVILRLIENGELSLDDYAKSYLSDNKWYSNFPNNGQIKIRNLLNHTSGLPRHLFQDSFINDLIADPLRKRSPEECIQSIVGVNAVHEVGMSWSYSDTNFILLGIIVEKITGISIYDLVDEMVIEELGLENTKRLNKRNIPGLVQGYVGQNNPFQMPPKMIDEDGNLAVEPSFEWTGGGYASNPGDLVELMKLVHESDFLNEETKHEMHSAVSMYSGKPFDQGYGLGTFVWNKKQDIRYGHAGFFPGYVTHVEYSTRRNYAMAIQINNDGYSRELQEILYRLELVIEKYLSELDEEKILANFETQENCWNNGDIECYMEAYSPYSKLQTVSRVGVTKGYESIIGDYKKYFPKDKMGTLFFDEITTRRLTDELYYVSGRFNLKFEGREELVQGWFSVNMKRERGNWFMITDHSS